MNILYQKEGRMMITLHEDTYKYLEVIENYELDLGTRIRKINFTSLVDKVVKDLNEKIPACTNRIYLNDPIRKRKGENKYNSIKYFVLEYSLSDCGYTPDFRIEKRGSIINVDSNCRHSSKNTIEDILEEAKNVRYFDGLIITQAIFEKIALAITAFYERKGIEDTVGICYISNFFVNEGGERKQFQLAEEFELLSQYTKMVVTNPIPDVFQNNTEIFVVNEQNKNHINNLLDLLNNIEEDFNRSHVGFGDGIYVDKFRLKSLWFEFPTDYFHITLNKAQMILNIKIGTEECFWEVMLMPHINGRFKTSELFANGGLKEKIVDILEEINLVEILGVAKDYLKLYPILTERLGASFANEKAKEITRMFMNEFGLGEEEFFEVIRNSVLPLLQEKSDNIQGKIQFDYISSDGQKKTIDIQVLHFEVQLELNKLNKRFVLIVDRAKDFVLHGHFIEENKAGEEFSRKIINQYIGFE